jgi:proliferating cell nuclear antigen
MSTSNCLELKTVQASSFKILIEALKELLTDTCIEFDETGMKIIAMDTSHIVLVHLKLDASKFEYYYCRNKISIGVNMLNFHKLIKTINSTDTLTLFMDDVNINNLGIKIENGDKNSKTIYKLNLLDLDNPQISIDPTEFNSVITLPSTDFQKICRDMSNVSDIVDIKNVGNQLIFSCKGDFCSQETILSDNDWSNIKKNGSTTEIIQGFYKLKFLVLFTKCTNLCNTVSLYIKTSYPLIIKYSVASLGEIKLAIAPSDSD